MHNAEGIGILGQEATLQVWAAINDYNRIALHTFNILFVEPLKINTELENAYFVDQLISGSTIDCSKAFTMTDFKGLHRSRDHHGLRREGEIRRRTLRVLSGRSSEVEPGRGQDQPQEGQRRQLRGDESITADNARIKAEDRFGVNCITENTAESTLTFKNISGVKVEKAVKLFIPVTVSHKWGTLTATVTVDLLPEASAE